MLPPGIHDWTLPQIEDVFVDSAPFSGVRQEIWEAFETYVNVLNTALPGSVVYVDGDFTIYRPDKAPRDVDFMVVADTASFLALAADVQDRLRHVRADDKRLDAVIVAEWQEGAQERILDQFSDVRGRTGRIIFDPVTKTARKKGVIRVRL